MRIALAIVTGTLFIAAGLAGTDARVRADGPSAAAAPLCHYDLWFTPQSGKELIVKLADVETLRGQKPGKRELHAQIAWTFESAGRRVWSAKGRCLDARLVVTEGSGKNAKSHELAWKRGSALAEDASAEALRFATDMAAPFSARIDRRGRVTVEPGQEILFGKGTLVRSARLGFAAALSGKATVPHGTWNEQGNLVGVEGADHLTSRFRIDRIGRHGKERVAFLAGAVTKGMPAAWKKKGATCTQTATFSLRHKYAMRSELAFSAPHAERSVKTSASWRKAEEEPARLASLRRAQR